MQQRQFLEVISREEAHDRFRAALGQMPRRAETVALARAHGRVLADDVVAAIDVPGFDRSDVDGFAVRAEDTFAATEEAPRSLPLANGSLKPGRLPTIELSNGAAIAIATGAALPRGADAVVMVEDTTAKGARIAVRRPTTPAANVSFAGSDIARGETILRAGQVLSARETGLLAALGIAQVHVVAKPRVAVISTGDEIVPPGEPLSPGKIFDSNLTVLSHLVVELGGEAIAMGVVPDDEQRLERILEAALDYDIVLMSGGTSKGEGDLSYRVVGRLGAPGIVVHGVALKPGKPLCLAVVDRNTDTGSRRIPIAVLPGFPSSAIFTFREYIGPVIREMAGLAETNLPFMEAVLPLRTTSARGRTEFVPVALTQNGGQWSAYPIGKGSGSITSFGHADGFVVIAANEEYIDAGAHVQVQLLTPQVTPADLSVIGSHCPTLDRLLSSVARQGFRVKSLAVGSQGGVQAVGRGEADLAGIHLLDETTAVYNRRFVPAGATLFEGYGRMQGIVFRRGDPRFENASVQEAVDAALADADCRFCNRNLGSGTRILIDSLLGSRRPSGYNVEVKSHHAVAAAVVQKRADWGLTIEAVARLSDLGFIPLQAEQFDFIVPVDRLERPAIVAFLTALQQLRLEVAANAAS